MTNYYIPTIYIVPLISDDGQASPRLFIAPEIRHEKISYWQSRYRDVSIYRPSPTSYDLKSEGSLDLE